MSILRSLVLVPLLLVLACSAQPGGEPMQPGGDGAGGANATSNTSETAEDDDSNVAKPAVELEGECTPRPNENNDLVADLRVVNTGNIGVTARVMVKWPQARDRGLTTWQRVRVEAGKTLPLTLSLRMDAKEAKLVDEAIDRNRKCRIGRRIIGAFGVPSG